MAEEDIMIEKDPSQEIRTEEALPEGKEVKKKAQAKKKSAASSKVNLATGRRKRAIARARIMAGAGSIRVNGVPISVVEPEELRMLMLEPVFVSPLTREAVRKADIEVSVIGGGKVSQAQAVRNSIAKALSAFSDNDVIRKDFLKYDRRVLVDDNRRVESKKYLGPKARARFQTSYR
ncbi:Ribosomal protein S9 [mine drainage metagenome]|uniref:Ribosomal protein S9 n=1 Tax=mine drainage metagenome TaxID=410659 RepID=T1AY66_9ZZZZ